MYKFSSVIIYRMETIETGLTVGSTLTFDLPLPNSCRRPLLQPQPRPRLAASADEDEDAAASDDDGVSDEEHGNQRTRPRSVRRAADMPLSMFTSGATRVAGAAHPSCQAKKEKKKIDGSTSAEDGDDVYGVEVVGDDMLREDGTADANL